jgi:hypothetical protein
MFDFDFWSVASATMYTDTISGNWISVEECKSSEQIKA